MLTLSQKRGDVRTSFVARVSHEAISEVSHYQLIFKGTNLDPPEIVTKFVP
jgi:hypothetical protein